ncbi:hypothetical protein BH20ACI1_BH20ACI1_24150 [soil metagenome]
MNAVTAILRNITIKNVEITGAKQIFTASGLPEKLIKNVKFINITAQGKDAGSIEYAKDWTMKNVDLQTANGEKLEITNSKNVESPKVIEQTEGIKATVIGRLQFEEGHGFYILVKESRHNWESKVWLRYSENSILIRKMQGFLNNTEYH